MCGRFDQHTLPYRYAGYLDAMLRATGDDPPPRYNVAPRTRAWVARAAADGGRELTALSWGLVPSWADDPAKGVRPINARSESVHARPMFRQLIATRRCLVPVDGFYEWQATPSGKRPHYIRMADDVPMLMAGLWDRWHHAGEPPLETYTVLTTRANARVGALHDRMPAIIGAADAAAWLDPETGGTPTLDALLQPCPAEWLVTYPVSLSVNAARNEGPELIKPVAA